MVAVVLPAYGVFEEIPSDGTTVDASILTNSDSDTSSLSIQAVHAFDDVDAWVGVNSTRLSHGEEVLSKDMTAQLQGGLEFMGASLQGFAKLNRDMDSDLTLSTGAYVRKVFQDNKLHWIFGAGSFVEKDDKVGDEITLEESEAEVVPYGLLIVGVKYDWQTNIGVYGKVVGHPQLDFQKLRYSLLLGSNVVLRDNLTLKLQSYMEVDGEHTDVTNTAILSLNF